MLACRIKKSFYSSNCATVPAERKSTVSYNERWQSTSLLIKKLTRPANQGSFSLSRVCYNETMSLIYITGVAGAGKSVVHQELQNLGYPVYDVDQIEIGAAHSIATGQRVTLPEAQLRTQEWYASHIWKILREPVMALKMKHRDNIVFLCGSAGDENEVWDLFDTVLFLDIDEQTLRRRIATRHNNDYGKAPYELARILDKHKTAKLKNTQRGAVIIDGNLPLSQVMSKILEYVPADSDQR